METKLIKNLNNSNAHRNSRMSVCDIALKICLIGDLIQIAFTTNDVNHFKTFFRH
jgi:hypothetical protein